MKAWQLDEIAIARMNMRIDELRGYVKVYQNLTATCIALGDRHGVVDAQNDIAKLEARIDEIRYWVNPL